MSANPDYPKLSVSERIQLVEDIGDSIASEAADAFPLTERQKVELYRRAEAHRANPASSITWEVARAKLFTLQAK